MLQPRRSQRSPRGRPQKPSVFAGGEKHNQAVDYFVIRCEKATLTPSDASVGFRAKFPCSGNSPVMRFYSPVNSAVIPLLIPLLYTSLSAWRINPANA